MAEIESFVASPTVEAFEAFTKEQLVLLAGRYEVKLSSSAKRNKSVMQTIIRDVLVQKEILSAELDPSPQDLSLESTASSLSYDQQRGLLQLQIDKGKQQIREYEIQIEKRILEREIELSRQEFEREKWALERKRLEEGKLESTPGNVAHVGNGDITRNIRLLPKFEEANVDTFFTLFERVADLHNWPDATRCLMLQCVLIGRAAQAYTALGVLESRTYPCVKKAVKPTNLCQRRTGRKFAECANVLVSLMWFLQMNCQFS